MNRIRIASAITVMLGAIYAAAGLLDSLQSFGLGLAVAAAGIIAYGATDFIESRHDEQIHRERIEVWARRDAEHQDDAA